MSISLTLVPGIERGTLYSTFSLKEDFYTSSLFWPSFYTLPTTLRRCLYYSSLLRRHSLFLPLLGGGGRGVSELYSERPHLNPPLKGEENRIRWRLRGDLSIPLNPNYFKEALIISKGQKCQGI
jgi:hypothetical protein